MSFRAILGPKALKQAIRRRKESTSRDHLIVHEAARWVFCAHFMIPVLEIRLSESTCEVRYTTDRAFRNKSSINNFVQMLMSGVITVQTVLGEENYLFERAVMEAQQLCQLAGKNMHGSLDAFDDMLATACRQTITELADPKMRSAILSVTRVLMRQRSDVTGHELQRLLLHTRHILKG